MRVLDAYATGDNIRKLRKSFGMTVSELRESLGLCSEQAIYKWQRGESMPTLDNCTMLAEVFDINLDELIKTKEIDSK